MSSPLSKTHKALVLEDRSGDFVLKTLPVPTIGHGSTLIKISAATILPYHRTVNTSYPLPVPLVGGFSAVGRVAALPPDAVSLRIGDLCYVDCVIRARDDSDSFFLSAVIDGFDSGSKKLMREVWRDGTFAEFARVPLENVIVLDEGRLVKELGYTEEQLAHLGTLMVPFGGLRDIRIEPGETVVVCPATGHYSAAGVQIVLAMGARVIAFARSTEKLEELEEFVKRGNPEARIETVVSTGDEDGDAKLLRQFRTVDAVLDLTPSFAPDSTFTKSAIKALRRGGRVSLMGSTTNIGTAEILTNNITLKGKSRCSFS